MQNSSKFFENRACQFFPCHKGLEAGDFNCLFCYCPLYTRDVCPGNPTFIKKDDGRIIKRCTDCLFPHKSENYEKIMRLLRTKKTNSNFLEEFHHGGENFSSKIDFSVNTNPLGLPESVKSVLKNSFEFCEKYPDQNCTELRLKLANSTLIKQKISSSELQSISPDFIFIGNGASELISLAVRAISPKNALLLAPSFLGYERALKICDCQIHYHNLKHEKKFLLDEEFFSSIEKFSPDMIFLCNPNNPTGKMIEFNLLEKIVSICEEKCIFLVIDECFIDFTSSAENSVLRFVTQNSHLLVLNAFTKIFAMAGLRLGYLISSNFALIQKIKFLQSEWSVSTLAQISGIAALEEADCYIEKTRKIIKEEKEFLGKELKALGFEVFESEANFILIRDCKASTSALSQSENFSASTKLDDLLLKRGISIRACENFRNLDKTYYRLAVKNHAENENLTSILKDIYQN